MVWRGTTGGVEHIPRGRSGQGEDHGMVAKGKVFIMQVTGQPFGASPGKAVDYLDYSQYCPLSVSIVCIGEYNREGKTMTDEKALEKEIHQYRNEKESVRRILGQIGGTSTPTKERLINIVFAVLVTMFFSFDVMRHALHMRIDMIPELFSVEIALLLVSMKIIWMIHRQQKVEHFQFWILNTIEFQMNSTAVRIRKIERMVEELSGKSAAEG